jgi:glutamyl-tRNA synthetase
VVVRRADGFVAYQLATVIDELFLGITDVVRGNDLREALPAQLSIYAALGQRSPRFWHGPLLYDDEGQKLSKREASAGLDVARSNGEDPAYVIGQLAAGLGLVPLGTRLSTDELLSEVRNGSALPLNS